MSKKVARNKKKIIGNGKTFFIIILLMSLAVSFTFNYFFKNDIKILEKSENIEWENLSNKIEDIHAKLSLLKEEKGRLLKAEGYVTFTATGYSANDPDSIQGTTNITSIGFDVTKEYIKYINICAVDPEFISYGSIIFAVANWEGKSPQDFYEKIWVAGDCGGKIKGPEKIDFLFNTKEEAVAFGIQGVLVKIIYNEL